MAEEGKKISFGFSKLKKQVNIISTNKQSKSDDTVQYIDCLEGKSIKVKNEEPKKGALVIPLSKPDSSSVVKTRLIEKQNKTDSNKSSTASEQNGESARQCSKNSDETSSSVNKNVVQSLDDLAAKEILEDLKKAKDNEEESKVFTVPMSTAPVGEKESSLEDYEEIPVSQFGMAMLRGMGWAPGKGIGKNEKLVAAQLPVLRPKGLGLGADKVIESEKPSAANEEPVKLVKGSLVRIIAGSRKDSFGEVIGFDDETGRLIVKMALGGTVVTFNEFMVRVVNKEEYIKNSKVINVKKYEDYKKKEGEDKKDVEKLEKTRIDMKTSLEHKSRGRTENDGKGASISRQYSEDKDVSKKQTKFRRNSDSLSDSEYKDIRKRQKEQNESDEEVRMKKFNKTHKKTSPDFGNEYVKSKSQRKSRKEQSESDNESTTKKNKKRRDSYSSDDQVEYRMKREQQTKQKNVKDMRNRKHRSSSSSSSSHESRSKLNHKSSHRNRNHSSSDDSEEERNYSPEVKNKNKKKKYKRSKRSRSSSVERKEAKYNSKLHRSHKNDRDKKREKDDCKTSKKHSKKRSSSASSEEKYSRYDKKHRASHKKKRYRSRSPT